MGTDPKYGKLYWYYHELDTKPSMLVIAYALGLPGPRPRHKIVPLWIGSPANNENLRSNLEYFGFTWYRGTKHYRWVPAGWKE